MDRINPSLKVHHFKEVKCTSNTVHVVIKQKNKTWKWFDSHEYTIHLIFNIRANQKNKPLNQRTITNTTCSSIGPRGINAPGAGVNEWMWWMNDSRLARRWLCCREERWDPDKPCWAERPMWARPCWAPEGGDWSFSLSQDDSLPPGDREGGLSESLDPYTEPRLQV